jgi:hypothetical protein
MPGLSSAADGSFDFHRLLRRFSLSVLEPFVSFCFRLFFRPFTELLILSGKAETRAPQPGIQGSTANGRACALNRRSNAPLHPHRGALKARIAELIFACCA